MMFSSNEQNIKEAVEAFMRQLGLQAGYDRVSAYEAWDQVVGSMIAKNTKSLKLKNGTLFVKVDSPVIRQELLMARSKICAGINEMIGKDLVKEVMLL